MSESFKIAVAQLNPSVGDIGGNLETARKARARAAELGADIIVFSELFLCGYPPEDLLLKPAFIDACRQGAEGLARDTADKGPGIVIGAPWREDDKLFNAALAMDEGRIIATRFKVDLPNYGVFDEKRLFCAGALSGPVDFRGIRIGLPICEDIWGEKGVCETLAEGGAEILISLNGSPYNRAKQDERHQVILRRIIESGLPMIYLNQIGGQDELVFDGGTCAINRDKSLAFQLPFFEPHIGLTQWNRSDGGWICAPQKSQIAPPPSADECDWRACVMGLRDYAAKNGFENIVLGLSGGIDSAVCAALGADALGADKVRCLMMPFRYTSEQSLADAKECAELLGVRYEILPLAPAIEGLEDSLKPVFDSASASAAESDAASVSAENLQSRARGVLLMAFSNRFGSLLVTTGNKSELSVGYATLYGDMNGGFNPIKDFYKSRVYELARWRNANRPSDCLGPKGRVIPENILSKPASAELRENQKDSDSLPDYEILDAILEGLIEGDLSAQEIAEKNGFALELVKRVENLLYASEYKRRQAAPGIKIGGRAFGRERRYPIGNRFRTHRP